MSIVDPRLQKGWPSPAFLSAGRIIAQVEVNEGASVSRAGLPRTTSAQPSFRRASTQSFRPSRAPT
eukprot:8192721-Alexandrium_andersonii.AAC.1